MKFVKQKLANFAFFGALAASAIQGTNTVAYKLAFDTMDPLLFTALRNIIIGLIFLFLMKGFRHLLQKKQAMHVLLHMFLGLFVLATLAIGIDLSTAINSSILSLVLPVFIYLFAVVFLREPALTKVMVGGAVALIGSITIIGLPVLLEQKLVIGDVVLLSSYIGLAAMIVHTKYAYNYLSTTDLLATRFLASGILITLYLVFFTSQSFADISAVSWWSLAYSTFFTGAFATGLYYYSLRYIKAEYAAPIFYIDPLIGVFAAAIILNEALTLSVTVGALIIIAGIFISHAHVSQVFHKIHIPGRAQRFRRYVATHLH